MITTEAIDARFSDPELHGSDHAVDELRILKIQFPHIGPVVGGDRLSGHTVQHKKIGMLLYPGMISSRMIRYPINDHFHSSIMDGIHQRCPVVHSTEFRV